MEKFETPEQSHAHSLSIFNQLYEYDSWLDNISAMADMGCGSGLDVKWWATLNTRDNPPVPHNYKCYAIDKDISVAKSRSLPSNVTLLQGDFNKRFTQIQFDFIWAHDSFQYSTVPLETLRIWSQSLTRNGWLALIVPQHTNTLYNRFYDVTYSGVYYHYTITNLIYMLATSGFDCSQMYALKKFNDPWLQIIVHKNGVGLLNPETTTWYTLLEKNLLPESAAKCIVQYGCLKSEELLLPWLDANLYRIDEQPKTEKPEIFHPPGPIFRLPESGPTLLKR